MWKKKCRKVCVEFGVTWEREWERDVSKKSELHKNVLFLLWLTVKLHDKRKFYVTYSLYGFTWAISHLYSVRTAVSVQCSCSVPQVFPTGAPSLCTHISLSQFVISHSLFLPLSVFSFVIHTYVFCCLYAFFSSLLTLNFLFCAPLPGYLSAPSPLSSISTAAASVWLKCDPPVWERGRDWPLVQKLMGVAFFFLSVAAAAGASLAS